MQPPALMEGLTYYTQSLLALWPEKAVIGSCVAGVVSLFGGDAYLLWMLGAMLVADFAFGLADAVRRRHFRCRMLAHGALKLEDGDALIFMNFRADRAREITLDEPLCAMSNGFYHCSLLQ